MVSVDALFKLVVQSPAAIRCHVNMIVQQITVYSVLLVSLIKLYSFGSWRRAVHFFRAYFSAVPVMQKYMFEVLLIIGAFLVRMLQSNVSTVSIVPQLLVM